jgi:acetyl esterase/lipase
LPYFTIILIFFLFTVCGANCQIADEAPAFSASQMGISTIALWPTGKISTSAEPGQAQPVLTLFRPQWRKANGAAVIIAPGGAYIGLALNIEGRQVADWYTARGITAFVLQYRLGGAHPYPEPLLDGQRAVRVVRSMSKELHLHPDKIGFTGFSAGGHLAAMVATSADNGDLARDGSY